jgi:hypothetical protein
MYIAQYYFVFSVLLTTFYLFFSMILQRITIKEFFKFISIIVIISILISFPYISFYFKKVILGNTNYQKVTLRDIENSAEEISIIDFFLPTPFSLANRVLHMDSLRTAESWSILPTFTWSIFLTILILTLSRHFSLNRIIKIYLILSIIFILLSLGPTIKLTKREVLAKNYFYLAFYNFFPSFDSILSPSRFSLLVFLSMLFIILEFFRRKALNTKKFFFLIYLTLIGFFIETFPTYYLYSSSFKDIGVSLQCELKNREDITSVLNVPPSKYGMYFQIFHEKPIEDIGDVNLKYIIIFKEFKNKDGYDFGLIPILNLTRNELIFKDSSIEIYEILN